MTVCSPEFADELLADMHERQRVSMLRNRDLISEVVEDDELDIDHPLLAELLNRIDPLWSVEWGSRSKGH